MGVVANISFAKDIELLIDRFRYELFEFMRHRVILVDTKEAFSWHTLTYDLKRGFFLPTSRSQEMPK